MRHRRTEDACVELLALLHKGWEVEHRDGLYYAKCEPDNETGDVCRLPIAHPDPVRLSEMIRHVHDEIQRRRLGRAIRSALPRRHPGTQRNGPRPTAL